MSAVWSQVWSALDVIIAGVIIALLRAGFLALQQYVDMRVKPAQAAHVNAILQLIESAATSAVESLNQTVVNDLKANNAFTSQMAADVKKAAVQQVKTELGPTMTQTADHIVGDLDQVITTRVEQAVLRSKHVGMGLSGAHTVTSSTGSSTALGSGAGPSGSSAALPVAQSTRTPGTESHGGVHMPGGTDGYTPPQDQASANRENGSASEPAEMTRDEAAGGTGPSDAGDTAEASANASLASDSSAPFIPTAGEGVDPSDSSSTDTSDKAPSTDSISGEADTKPKF